MLLTVSNRRPRRRGEMERVKGIEPSYSAWKAAALPLSYTRISLKQVTKFLTF